MDEGVLKKDHESPKIVPESITEKEMNFTFVLYFIGSKMHIFSHILTSLKSGCLVPSNDVKMLYRRVMGTIFSFLVAHEITLVLQPMAS